MTSTPAPIWHCTVIKYCIRNNTLPASHAPHHHHIISSPPFIIIILLVISHVLVEEKEKNDERTWLVAQPWITTTCSVFYVKPIDLYEVAMETGSIEVITHCGVLYILYWQHQRQHSVLYRYRCSGGKNCSKNRVFMRRVLLCSVTYDFNCG